jgi:alginate production protein
MKVGGYRCGVGLVLMTVQVAAFGQSTAGASALQLPHLAQFQAPAGVRDGTPTPERPARPALPSELRFSYAYGSDSELVYRRDDDLDKRLRDNTSFFAPTLFGFVDYRPNAWLASRLEATLEVPMDVKKQRDITLPTGEIVPPTKRQPSILIDQAYVTVKDPGSGDEFTIGRRNFEDPRLWLYDAALDAAIVKVSQGYLEIEASVSQEDLVDADVLNNVLKTRVNNYIVYADYRGIENHRLAAYWIKRDDRSRLEGRPVFMGVRAYGRPTDRGNYWAEFGIARGRDELQQSLRGKAFDVGFTYRYPGVPLSPSVTFGYAVGSGDGNPNDGRNTEFRQTGLQSNETRFGGLTQFKRYGETIDPELSNVKIFTAGMGLRLAPNAFVDVVYHRYRLKTIADVIRNWALTAEMNQNDNLLSRDVGDEVDIIVGWRNLFGVRRLGFEVRAGIFRPGKAFANDVGTDPNEPTFGRADKSVSVLAVIIY